MIQQLKDTDNWVFDYQTDKQGRLTHLFLAYAKTVQIFQSHPDILMADCTYWTNRFKMPLLHFLGCNSIGGHFTTAFCFLPSESQIDYLWAVGCIQRLLYEPINRSPNVLLSDNEDALKSACSELWPGVHQLLCLWHINKNVQNIYRSTSNG
jgi:hypothetical protein